LVDDFNSEAVLMISSDYSNSFIKPEARRGIYWTNVSINTKVGGIPWARCEQELVGVSPQRRTSSKK
jgi:hypothetical protein